MERTKAIVVAGAVTVTAALGATAVGANALDAKPASPESAVVAQASDAPTPTETPSPDRTIVVDVPAAPPGAIGGTDGATSGTTTFDPLPSETPSAGDHHRRGRGHSAGDDEDRSGPNRGPSGDDDGDDDDRDDDGDRSGWGR